MATGGGGCGMPKANCVRTLIVSFRHKFLILLVIIATFVLGLVSGAAFLRVTAADTMSANDLRFVDYAPLGYAAGELVAPPPLAWDDNKKSTAPQPGKEIRSSAGPLDDDYATTNGEIHVSFSGKSNAASDSGRRRHLDHHQAGDRPDKDVTAGEHHDHHHHSQQHGHVDHNQRSKEAHSQATAAAATKTTVSDEKPVENASADNLIMSELIEDDIFWGPFIDRLRPAGFREEDSDQWTRYLNRSDLRAVALEEGCGRMQNRLVTFSDGARACVRYRQNIDQIQGELFSFYLSKLLNLTNFAPTAVKMMDTADALWSTAPLKDMASAQWTTQRPVVLTKFIPDLVPALIPLQFQPLERHLNKLDVKNITLSLDKMNNSLFSGGSGGNSNNTTARTSTSTNTSTRHKNEKNGFAESGGNNNADIWPTINWSDLMAKTTTSTTAARTDDDDDDRENAIIAKNAEDDDATAASLKLRHNLIELVQWSDLILFDYLIAHLDRVVNNLYNLQWNAEIMEAPAHNLLVQPHDQLLIFLDNESGIFHGYRLLAKYEAYHNALLENLCIFRRSTITQLQRLKYQNIGALLNDHFVRSTPDAQVREALPRLGPKTIKILRDRIDRVLGQVQKCRKQFGSQSSSSSSSSPVL